MNLFPGRRLPEAMPANSPDSAAAAPPGVPREMKRTANTLRLTENLFDELLVQGKAVVTQPRKTSRAN
jgi:hypothetical protein